MITGMAGLNLGLPVAWVVKCDGRPSGIAVVLNAIGKLNNNNNNEEVKSTWLECGLSGSRTTD
jgi:hypothetical protein